MLRAVHPGNSTGTRPILDGSANESKLVKVCQQRRKNKLNVDTYLINIAALRLAHLDEVLDQQLAVVLAYASCLVEALVRVEGELLLRHFQFLALILQHVRERSLLTRGEFVLHPLDVGDATLAGVAPLCVVFASEELLFAVVEGLLLLQVRVLDLLPRLEQLAVALVLEEMVLHVAAEEVLEEFSLLGDECAGSGDHLAQVLVHGVLVLAPRHSVQLAELLDELVHGEHGRGQRLTLVIDVLRALDHLVVQYLIGVNEVSHLAAKDCAVRDHLSWHAALLRSHILHTSHILLLLRCFRRLGEFFGVVVLEPIAEVLV